MKMLPQVVFWLGLISIPSELGRRDFALRSSPHERRQ
jgi:hypothetical protein